jgi:putative transposase
VRHPHPVAPNVLARRFAVGTPNQVWAGDITYLPTREGWLYLAVRLDLGSRRVIGWAVRATLERELTLALRGALATR